MEHLRPGAPGQREGNHAGDGGERGHHDRTQPPLTGIDHALLGGNALGTKFLIGVEQQNAVFGDNADHHDEPHERRNIKGGARDQQRQKNAGRREQGRGHDRGRSGEASEFKE